MGKQALPDEKIWISRDFDQKSKFPLRLLFDKMGLEIMFFDLPVRKQAFLDEKISILHSGQSKGLTHDFVQKLEKIHLSVILDK